MGPGDVLAWAVGDESHVLVLGRPGSGKSTLVRLALAGARDYPALVFDYVGNYRGFVDYYGPYPINPLEFIDASDLVDALARVILTVYGRVNAMTPAMEEAVLTAIEACGDRPSIPCAIQWLLTLGERYWRSEDMVNAMRGARRRMLVLLNNQLFGTETHPVLAQWIAGDLNAQVGIDLSGVGLQRAIAYVTILLTVLARREGRLSRRWRFVIVDEAQYFSSGLGEGVSPLEEAVRVGRNYGLLFIAITQNDRYLESFRDVFKVVIDFNRSSQPRRARFIAYPTNPALAGNALSRTIEDMPVVKDFVNVDPGLLDGVRRRGVDWLECLRRCNADWSPRRLSVVRVSRTGAVEVRDLRARSPCLWECLGNG